MSAAEEPAEQTDAQPDAPKPQKSYWEDRSAVMPATFYERTFEQRAFEPPLKLQGVAVDAPRPFERAHTDASPAQQLASAMTSLHQSSVAPRFDRNESMVAAILTDDAAPVIPPDAVLPPVGGPHFVGDANAAPIVPPGVRAIPPAALAPGTYLPTWTTPVHTTPRRKRHGGRLVLSLLVVAMLGAGGYVAYPHVRSLLAQRSAPADLRAYVGGQGTTYAPSGQGYSIRLPGVPVHRDGPFTVPDLRLSLLVHRSIVSGADYEIVVWDAVLPAAGKTVLPAGALGALRDPQIGGAGAWSGVHAAEISGVTAYEGELHPPNTLTFKVAVLIHGSRIYVIRVESRSVGTVFDAVANSFRLSS